MEGKFVLWDKNVSVDEAKFVLSDERNPRFVAFAAALLSASNEPNEILGKYLDSLAFCRNWRKIKRQMRKNKWNDSRILFWDQVFQVLRDDFKAGHKEIFNQNPKRDVRVDPWMEKLASQIRDARRKRGLTQAELARAAGLSQQRVSFVERGYVNFSVQTLKKLCDALGLELKARIV